MHTRALAAAQLRAAWWHQQIWTVCVIGSMGIAYDGERIRIAYVGPGQGQGAGRRERKGQA